MSGWLKHPSRVTVRLIWLGGEFAFAGLNFLFHHYLAASKSSPEATRAKLVQLHARRLLRVIGGKIKASGPVPTNGLLVSNHLSYLDILVLGSLAPSVFVAKREIKSWPVFGWLTSLAGSVYVNREKRTHAGQAAKEIEAALHSGVLVILFPEGTSSDGKTILPFKSALLEPATRHPHSLSVGLIQYEINDGDVVEEVCYWKDMTLVTHLINLLSKRSVRASVKLAPLHNGSANRKELALQLHAEVSKLKHAVNNNEGIAVMTNIRGQPSVRTGNSE
jgi:lyso-ornithine lipid O-acyltransferase